MLTILQDGQPIRARDERKPDHFWADKEIVEDFLPQVGAIAFAVYMLLCYYARSSTGRAWPSISTMAKKLKLSEPTVRKALDELMNAGLILISENYKLSKKGMKIPQPYTYTLTAVEKRRDRMGVVNDVDQGGKRALPGVVNVLYPNNTNIEQDINNNTSLPQAAEVEAPKPKQTKRIKDTTPKEPILEPHKALIEAYHYSLPDEIRPSKPAYGRYTELATAMVRNGVTPYDVVRYVTAESPSYQVWAAEHKAKPAMSLNHVDQEIKGWLLSHTCKPKTPAVKYVPIEHDDYVSETEAA